MAMRFERRCKFCKEPIPDGKRWDARFCSDLCRGRYHRGYSSGTATNGNAGKRAVSRDGNGVKLYLQPHELVELKLGPPYPMNLQRKLHGAIQRLERNANG
jgi:hypothetical protein